MIVTTPFRSRPEILCISLLFVLSLLSSCHKETTLTDNNSMEKDLDFGLIFEKFWDGMNRNYVMWDIDSTDWSKLRQSYGPAFSRLDIKDPKDRLMAVGYLQQMTAGLKDAHFMLEFDDPQLWPRQQSPADERLKLRTDYHRPFAADYFDRIARKYLDQPFYDAYYHTDLTHQLAYKAGTIKQQILYFRMNAFAIQRAYQHDQGRMKTLLDYVFTSLADPHLKGLILDLRDNTGGDLRDLNFLIGRLIDKPLTYGYSRYKLGNNPLDYSPWMPAIIRPIPNSRAYAKKIVVLLNMYSISMAELTAMALNRLPNTTLVGERTYGANGMLAEAVELNGGSFAVPDFVRVNMASALFKYADQQIYESIGFPPTVVVPHKQTATDTDGQLEAAIQLITP
ncbi:hypothetical protein BWD42_07510 [Sphingobacterium sp. CZ-UAM]|uniref:S41 family peptidase n=1 Tax=Sphingobacterium sp. CZ-UAM TaxID=1933868 RepID=UPI0009875346|nr:S41 family peptidase [Sphingobacterium sp. CZ-UAM]OOG19740.1 hypothetical protein BWD42_07510 [Sphingobacterium sp. CZ-UAM]